MDVKKRGKRFFVITMTVLMFILTVGTIIFAEEGRGSYSLVIQKILAQGSPEEAKNKEYTFKIEGITRDKDGLGTKVEKTKTIKGEGKVIVNFSGPTEITAIELTDSEQIEVDGIKWNVSDIQRESQMNVSGRVSTISISKDDGSISIKRPGKAQTATYFQVVGRDFKQGKEIYHSGPMKIGPGEEKTLENLNRGEYTIEELKSDGFSILVGPRKAPVLGGQKGEVYINGNSGKLTIMAPGSLGGPETYYYIVKKDGQEYKRDVLVKAGDSYKLEHLPAGRYTVEEYLYSGNQEYTVTVPQTDDKPVGPKYFSKFMDPSATKITLYYFDVNGDYIDQLKYGPLWKDGKKLPETATYKFRYQVCLPDLSAVSGYVYNTREAKAAKGNTTYRSAYYDNRFIPGPANRFWVGAQATAATVGAKCQISWVEHTYKELSRTYQDLASYPQTVDERGWMTISKPEDTDIAAKEITYYYTVTDANQTPITGFTVTDKEGNPITGNAVTDKDGTTVMLKAGQTVTLNGLAKGTYDVKQTILQDTPADFRIIVEDDEKDTTQKEHYFDIEVFGERSLTVHKPAGNDGGRTYGFIVYQKDQNGNLSSDNSGNITSPVVAQLSLGAGEDSQEIRLLPGKYQIKAIDDEDAGFELAYSDSSTVLINSASSATVTFTNTFAEVQGAYRVIHEYYLKDSNGGYHYEGSSLLNTIYGKLDDEEYDYQTVGLELMHGNHKYRPMARHGYGMVSEETKDKAAAFQLATPGNATPSNSERQDTRQQKASSSNASLSGGQTEKATPGNAASYRKARKPDVEILDGDEVSEDETPDGDEVLEYDISGEGYLFTGRNTGGRDTGILLSDQAEDKDGNGYFYEADESMHHVKMTEDGEEIIIMRYYREEEPVTGSYKVIHVYYLRDKDGDHWEGASGLETLDVGWLTQEKRKKPHTADEVEKDPDPQNFDVDGKKYHYTYDYPVYGKVTQSSNTGAFTGEGNAGEGWRYTPDTKMKAAYATEAGDQIIILRYYRTVDVEGSVKASYNVVHEYYYREKEPESDDSHIGSEEGSRLMAKGGSLVPMRDGRVGDGAAENITGEDSFNGTLTDRIGYVYTFEGITEIENISAPIEQHYTKENVQERNRHAPEGSNQFYTYQYYNVGYGRKEGDGYVSIRDKQWAAALESGEEIIILRYIREEVPTEPTKPNKPGGSGGSGNDPGPTPKPTPPSPTPGPVTEEPSNPEPDMPQLPDPNDPASPEQVTIVENGVPQTYLKVWNPETQEFVYMLENEIPLAWMNQLPKTGDGSRPLLWMVLAAISLGGMFALGHVRLRKKG